MNGISYRCSCRALDTEGDRVRFTHRWLFAFRGELCLTDSAIECGNWTLLYKDILDAVIYESPHSPIAAVLVILCAGRTYQFQLLSSSPWYYVLDPFWHRQVLFPVRFKRLNIRDYLSDKYSLRVTLLTCSGISFVLFVLVVWLRRYFWG